MLKEVARLREQEEEIAKRAKACAEEAENFAIEQVERKKWRTRTALSLLLESTDSDENDCVTRGHESIAGSLFGPTVNRPEQSVEPMVAFGIDQGVGDDMEIV